MVRPQTQRALGTLYIVLKLGGPMPSTTAREVMRRLGYDLKRTADASVLLGIPLYADTWELPPLQSLGLHRCTKEGIAHARHTRSQAQASVFQRQKLRRVRTGGTAYGGRRKGGVREK